MSISEQKCEICPENYYCPGQENIDIYDDRYFTVPYIQSDQHSYINTNIIPTMDKDFYFLGELPEKRNTSSKQIPFYWVRTDPGSYITYGCIFNPDKPGYVRAYRNSCGDKAKCPYTPINALSGRTIEYQTDGQYFYLNGDKYEFPESLPIESVPYPIYLLKLNEANTNAYTSESHPEIKIYRWRVTQGDTVLQDLVPVYDTLNNEYGMYDIISHQFFGNENAQGNLSGTNGKEYCPTQTNNIAPHSAPGSTNINDCGRVLRFGTHKLYVTRQKYTSPTLAIQYGNNVFYAPMTNDVRGYLRTEYNGKTYSIYNPSTD